MGNDYDIRHLEFEESLRNLRTGTKLSTGCRETKKYKQNSTNRIHSCFQGLFFYYYYFTEITFLLSLDRDW